MQINLIAPVSCPPPSMKKPPCDYATGRLRNQQWRQQIPDDPKKSAGTRYNPCAMYDDTPVKLVLSEILQP